MTPQRHRELMDNPMLKLTAEEKQRWHFCWDWDGLLIEADSPEFSCCTCAQGRAIRDASPSSARKEQQG
jgi:hypothetical protein